MKKSFIDLSHTIEHGMITYEGIPAPAISDIMSRESSRSHYAEGTEFHIGRINLASNTGTYLDTPFHRYKDGPDLADIRLEDVAALPGKIIRVNGDTDKMINPTFFKDMGTLRGMAVLVHTGFSQYWSTGEYFSGDHPFLTKDAAEFLADCKVKLVGIDSYNIDSTSDKSRPVHSILLKAGIYIIEHMTNLESLPETGFYFYAIPQKIRGLGSFPVRAFAIV
jgi:kynurenine formamidase